MTRPWLSSLSVIFLGTALCLFPISLHAMDEETAKTIADMKAQMQSLIDEVQKLKAQASQTNSPPPARLRPAEKEKSPSPIIPHPVGYTPFLAPQVKQQATMEYTEGASTELAPVEVQKGDQVVPMLDVSEKGLIFRSEDNQHLIRLGGLLQFDDREFVDPGTSDMSKFLIRRARPYAAGYFYDDWEYRFAPEFALSAPNANTYSTTIADAFINYQPCEEIQVEVGKFVPPVGFETLVPAAFLPFAERSLTSNLIPNRDLGLMIHGGLFEQRLSWAAMVAAGGRNDTVQTGLDYGIGPVGHFRLYAQPFRDADFFPEELAGLHLGVGGTLGWQTQGLDQPTANLFQNFSTDGGNTFLSFPTGLNVQGEIWRISPQLYYHYGPFGMWAEFTAQKQGVNTSAVSPGGGYTNWESTAWDATLDWVITGEPSTLGGVVPLNPVDFDKGHFGAWELALRYDGLAAGANMFRPVNQGGLGISQTSSATGVSGVSLGLNWYLNRLFRLGVSIDYNAFTGGGAQNTTVENNELGFITRLQLLY